MDFLIFHWSARLSFPQSFFFLPALTLFFLIMVHCMTLTHLLAFLTLYLLKISLRCGTFHCFTDEVSISISSLELRKLNHWKESRSQKIQGLNPQNLVASLTLLFLWHICSYLLGILIKSGPLSSLPLLLNLSAVFMSWCEDWMCWYLRRWGHICLMVEMGHPGGSCNYATSSQAESWPGLCCSLSPSISKFCFSMIMSAGVARSYCCLFHSNTWKSIWATS